MRIGFFTDDYFPRKDGCTYTVKKWKEKLEERGHEVYVIYPGSKKYEPGKNEIPVPSIGNPLHHGHNFPLFIRPSNIPELDVVHCHSPGPLGLIGKFYAWRNDIPAVYTHHTPLEEYMEPVLKFSLISKAVEMFYKTYERYLISRFNFVTSNTGKDVRGIKSEKLPVGIDMEFFHPVEEEFDFPGEKPILGYNKRMSEEKNIEKILEMVEGFEGSVLLIGEGRHREELEKKAPENVYFMDFLPRENLRVFYSSIDLWVTASTSETLSLSSLEACACDTPVIAPDTFPFDRTIEEGNGLRYKPGDTEDFGETVREALDAKFNPRETVEKYSMSKTLDTLEELYGDI